MKVLFTFSGLPHYYNLILNKLNRIPDLEIVVVVPFKKSENIGSGVFETEKDIEFKLIRLEEYQTFYRKSFFKNFLKTVYSEKPDIIVTNWPYILYFIFNPFLLKKIKRQNIKIIFKEIPFQVPKYNEAISYYTRKDVIDENLRSGKDKNKILMYLKGFILREVRKKYYGIIDAFVNYIEDAYEIIGSYGVDKNRIFITYNSPDTDELFKAKKIVDESPNLLPENNYRLIHVGRLVEWKRVDLLIKVLKRLLPKFPEAELIVIGNGPKENDLKNLAEELGIKEKVLFQGAIYDTVKLGKFFKSSSLYVLGGMGGLSINEAMAFEKPVVCSVCDGTEKSLVIENYSGKYFDAGNEDDLFKVIDELFSDTQKLKLLGENSFEIIKNKINTNTVVKGYLDAFNFVTNNKFNLKSNL